MNSLVDYQESLIAPCVCIYINIEVIILDSFDDSFLCVCFVLYFGILVFICMHTFLRYSLWIPKN